MVKRKYSTFHLTGKKAFIFLNSFLFFILCAKKKKSAIVCPAIAAKLIVAGQDRYMNNTNDLISKDKESLTLK